MSLRARFKIIADWVSHLFSSSEKTAMADTTSFTTSVRDRLNALEVANGVSTVVDNTNFTTAVRSRLSAIEAHLGVSTVVDNTNFTTAVRSRLSALEGSSSVIAIASTMAIGLNPAFNAWYDWQYALVDITHGTNPAVNGGPSQNLPVPIANYDASDWSIQSLPAGATGYMVFLDTTDVSTPYKATWSNAYDGIITVAQCTGVGSQNANDISFTPQTIAQAQISTSPSRLIFNPGTAGILPRDLKVRPVVDPGTVVTAAFKAKYQALSGAGGPFRPMHWTTVEENLNPTDYPTTKFPVDGDGQLGEPILTATNRNTPRSVNWWQFREGTPFEILVQVANELNRDLRYPFPINADDTYYNKLFDIVLNGSTVNGVHYPALNSGLKFKLTLGNEPWNFAYTGTHQLDNEANFRGTVGPANKTSCRLAATTNITLSGAQTIDGTAAVTGDRILLPVQTDPTQNGAWIANTAGPWTRAADTIAFGDVWFITAGSTLINTTFSCRTNVGTITPGTTPLSITRFTRVDRYAERACHLFILAEAAFSAQRSRLVNTIEWQNDVNVGAAGIWAPMLAMPDRLGGLISAHVNCGSTAPYYGDDSTGISYAGTTAAKIASYFSASPLNIDNIVSVVAAHKAALAAIAGQGGVPIKWDYYEGGRQDVNSDATFLQNLFLEPTGHDCQAYFLNELRRQLGTDVSGAYHCFVAPLQAGAGGTTSLLHQITDTIASIPAALATEEASAGLYTILDPTLTIDVQADALVDAVAGTFSKGLLPEATCSLVDAGGFFKLDAATPTNGLLTLKVKTANPPAGSYSLSLVQTYTSAPNGPTRTTNFTFTVGAALLKDDFNDNSIDPAKWDTPSVTLLSYAPYSNTGVTIAETNQRLEFTFTTTNGNRGNCLPSHNTVDVTDGRRRFFKTIQSAGAEEGIAVGTPSNDVLLVTREGTGLVLYHNNQTTGPVTFTNLGGGAGLGDISSFPWVGFRKSGANLVLETAGPGASNPPLDSEWTVQRTITWPSFIGSASNIGLFASNNFGITAGTQFIADGFNSAT